MMEAIKFARISLFYVVSLILIEKVCRLGWGDIINGKMIATLTNINLGEQTGTNWTMASKGKGVLEIRETMKWIMNTKIWMWMMITF